MGSFSWLRADRTTKRSNLTDGDKYKILIPAEFGGGFIKDTYWDYGVVFHYDDTKEDADLYGILAYWNKCEDMVYEGDEYPSTMKDILERGNTSLQHNRCRGIDIGCHDHDIDKLKYPLKLVSASYAGTYEECEGRSYGDPEQGFYKTYWEELDERYHPGSQKEETPVLNKDTSGTKLVGFIFEHKTDDLSVWIPEMDEQTRKVLEKFISIYDNTGTSVRGGITYESIGF